MILIKQTQSDECIECIECKTVNSQQDFVLFDNKTKHALCVPCINKAVDRAKQNKMVGKV